MDILGLGMADGWARVTHTPGVATTTCGPGIVAVAILVAVFTWNDFGGPLVLLQRPEVFTAPLAIGRFATLYATDQGLTFAGLAIVIVPPLLLFLVFRGSFLEGLTTGVVRR